MSNGEIVVKITVPEGVPKEVLELAKESAERKIREWLEFVKAAEKVKLDEDDLELLERAREEAWKDVKKRYGL